MTTKVQNSLQKTPTETSPEERPRAASILPWRGWDLWLRILGVALAVLGGIVCSLPTHVPMALYLLLPLVVGVVSAALLRSWWAILIVPVAFRVGFLLVGIPLAGAFDSLALGSSEATVEVFLTLYGLQLVPVAIGMAIGIPTGKEIGRRLHQQAAASQVVNSSLS